MYYYAWHYVGWNKKKVTWIPGGDTLQGLLEAQLGMWDSYAPNLDAVMVGIGPDANLHKRITAGQIEQVGVIRLSGDTLTYTSGNEVQKIGPAKRVPIDLQLLQAGEAPPS